MVSVGKKVKALILYVIFKTLTVLTSLLPNFLLKKLGIFLGDLAMIVADRQKRVASRNLERIDTDKYFPCDQEKIYKKTFRHFGQVLLEFFLMPEINKKNLNEFFSYKGIDELESVLERDKGAIIYTAHQGNWEWLGPALSLKDYNTAAIVEEQNYFDDYINRIREKMGVKTIKTGISLRKAYEVLQKNGVLIVLGDLHAGSSGLELTFLGRSASVYRGVCRLAEKTGAKIIPAFMVRKAFAEYEVRFYPPLESGADLSNREEEEKLNELLELTENIIKEYPWQWNWFYKRWKLADRRLKEKTDFQ